MFSLFAKEAFLDYLLNDAKAQPSRAVFQKGLAPMLTVLELFDDSFMSEKRNVCKSFNCSEFEVKSKGLFKGMNYCAKHHMERFGSVASSPTLEIFLDYKFLSIELVDFLQKRLFRVNPLSADSLGDEFEIIESQETRGINLRASVVGLNSSNPVPLVLHYYYFHESVKQYEQLTSKSLRSVRIRQFEKKFLNPTNSGRYVWFPDEIRSELLESLHSGRSSKQLFSRADTFSLSILSRIFPIFTHSKYYEKAVISVTL
jgi:hypothetical protein